MTDIYEKRGSLNLLLVPLLKAFALPNLSRTSNANTHADMYIFSLTALERHNEGCQLHTHEHLLLLGL